MRRLFIPLLLVIVCLGAAGLARGELEQSGNIRLAVQGGFKPQALPRLRSAPVTATLDASISTVDGTRPPQLRRISIAINRYGRISTRGLPICDPAEIETTTTEGALSRCGAARVGKGNFRANVDFPSRPSIQVRGKMLAFNSRVDGRRAILLHIYGFNPVQATVVLVFKISRERRGTFGTVFSTVIPRIASDLGYVTGVRLTFGRRYRVNGKPMSFLSARCAAPAGFPGLPFTFARASFGFATGRQLTTTLVRSCRVR